MVIWRPQTTNNHGYACTRYLLIEAYGLECFYEINEGLFFDTGYTSHSFVISWLFGFGDKVTELQLSCEVNFN